MLGGPSQDGHMLVAELARGKRLAGLRQVLELAGDPDPLGGRPTGKLALRAQPGHQVDRPVRGVFAGLIEAAQPFGETASTRSFRARVAIRPSPSREPSTWRISAA